MKHKYYLIYLYGEKAGAEYISRDEPIDNENALIEEHQRLEEQFKVPVLIIDWKRID